MSACGAGGIVRARAAALSCCGYRIKPRWKNDMVYIFCRETVRHVAANGIIKEIKRMLVNLVRVIGARHEPRASSWRVSAAAVNEAAVVRSAPIYRRQAASALPSIWQNVLCARRRVHIEIEADQ